MQIPKIIFIIPYRKRECQKHFFIHYMKYILEDYNENDYKIMFSRQCDERTFNRGAKKNIGFLAVKSLYPNDYKNITFVFHDVDVMPYRKNLLDYETKDNIIKHFYGFNYALGGIISIKGSDFEKINGFTNFWGWALEDNILQKRALKHKLEIDRNNFFNIGDNNILHIHDDFKKPYVEKNIERYKRDNGVDGLYSITQLKYTIEEKNDYNKYYMINITSFEGLIKHSSELITMRDMKKGNKLGSDSNYDEKKLINFGFKWMK